MYHTTFNPLTHLKAVQFRRAFVPCLAYAPTQLSQTLTVFPCLPVHIETCQSWVCRSSQQVAVLPMRCGLASELRGLACPSEPLRTRKLPTALRCWLCRAYGASADAVHVDVYVTASSGN